MGGPPAAKARPEARHRHPSHETESPEPRSSTRVSGTTGRQSGRTRRADEGDGRRGRARADRAPQPHPSAGGRRAGVPAGGDGIQPTNEGSGTRATARAECKGGGAERTGGCERSESAGRCRTITATEESPGTTQSNTGPTSQTGASGERRHGLWQLQRQHPLRVYRASLRHGQPCHRRLQCVAQTPPVSSAPRPQQTAPLRLRPEHQTGGRSRSGLHHPPAPSPTTVHLAASRHTHHQRLRKLRLLRRRHQLSLR